MASYLDNLITREAREASNGVKDGLGLNQPIYTSPKNRVPSEESERDGWFRANTQIRVPSEESEGDGMASMSRFVANGSKLQSFDSIQRPSSTLPTRRLQSRAHLCMY